MSHPMWVRGLKLRAVFILHQPKIVAPHVGAWIETTEKRIEALRKLVAPHVGAWIETYCYDSPPY